MNLNGIKNKKKAGILLFVLMIFIGLSAYVIKSYSDYMAPKLKYNLSEEDKRTLEKELNVNFSEDFVCQSAYHRRRDYYGVTIYITSSDWKSLLINNFNFDKEKNAGVIEKLKNDLSAPNSYNEKFTTCSNEKVRAYCSFYNMNRYFYYIDNQCYMEVTIHPSEDVKKIFH